VDASALPEPCGDDKEEEAEEAVVDDGGRKGERPPFCESGSDRAFSRYQVTFVTIILTYVVILDILLALGRQPRRATSVARTDLRQRRVIHRTSAQESSSVPNWRREPTCTVVQSRDGRVSSES
jgi:hypothetical protein